MDCWHQAYSKWLPRSRNIPRPTRQKSLQMWSTTWWCAFRCYKLAPWCLWFLNGSRWGPKFGPWNFLNRPYFPLFGRFLILSFSIPRYFGRFHRVHTDSGNHSYFILLYLSVYRFGTWCNPVDTSIFRLDYLWYCYHSRRTHRYSNKQRKSLKTVP